MITMRTNKAVTELPKYRSIVDRYSVRKSQNYEAEGKPNRNTDTRYMAKKPIDEGFYA